MPSPQRSHTDTDPEAGNPASTVQALWQAARAEPASSYFNIPIAFRLKGRLDPNALEGALNAVVRRHDTLRTVFEETDGSVAKKVLPDLRTRLARHEIASAPEPERHLAMLLAREADAPFDLQTGPLFRTGLVTLSEREHVLFLTIHHAIFDQWSSAVLFRELSALYDLRAYGRPWTEDAEPTQHAVCVRQQREWLGSADHQRQLQYWRAQLRGPLPITEMPRPRPGPAVASGGATYWFELPVPLGHHVTTVARAHRITPFMLLLATFMILLHRYTGEEDMCIASALARRRRLEWESVIGLLMNGVMFRTRVHDDDTGDAIFKQVRETALWAYDNQDVPHGEVRRAVGAPDSREQRERQAFFHCAPRVRPEFTGVETTVLPTATSCPKRDFGLSMYDEWRDGQVRWSGEVEYNAGLFSPSDIVRIVEHFESLLANVCSNPGQTVAALTAEIPGSNS
jgi:Condensation domain